MSDNNLNRDRLTGGENRRAGMGRGMIALIAGIAVLAVLFMWAPWNHNRTADNSGPGTTVGSNTTRPSAPMAPTTAPSPAAPAAPTTTR